MYSIRARTSLNSFTRTQKQVQKNLIEKPVPEITERDIRAGLYEATNNKTKKDLEIYEWSY